jgi:imidazoleglycerol-phosphate dehydratase
MAFKEALGDKKGIVRYGSMILPMDEALLISAIDCSGRALLSYDVEIPTAKVGYFDTELVEEFWLAFVREAACTLHFFQIKGTNSHHIIEGIYKSAGRAFREAVSFDKGFENDLPSTKGVL